MMKLVAQVVDLFDEVHRIGTWIKVAFFAGVAPVSKGCPRCRTNVPVISLETIEESIKAIERRAGFFRVLLR